MGKLLDASMLYVLSEKIHIATKRKTAGTCRGKQIATFPTWEVYFT
jgi:hypothetical protein